MIPSDWGDIHGSLEGLEMKNEEEKSKIPYDKPWGAAPAKASQYSLCPSSFGALRLLERQGHIDIMFFPYLFALVLN